MKKVLQCDGGPKADCAALFITRFYTVQTKANPMTAILIACAASAALMFFLFFVVPAWDQAHASKTGMVTERATQSRTKNLNLNRPVAVNRSTDTSQASI